MTDKYWVGGTGTWNTTTTHWSLTSGGVAGAAVPGASDNAIFDSNSGGGSVTISGSRSCLSLSTDGTLGTGAWTGSFLASSSTLNINGNCNAPGSFPAWAGAIVFAATSGTNNINLSGNYGATSVTISGAGGTFNLIADIGLTSGGSFPTAFGNLILTSGILNIGAFNLCIGTFSLGIGTKTLNMGSGYWYITGSSANFNTNVLNLTLNAETSSVFFTAVCTFLTGGLTFNDVGIIGGNALTISNNGIFRDFLLPDSAVLKFTSSTTQTVRRLRRWNSESGVGFHGSDGGSQLQALNLSAVTAGTFASLVLTGGYAVVEGASSIKDNHVSGAAAFAPGGTNVSGNSGWTFSAPPYTHYFSQLLPTPPKKNKRPGESLFDPLLLAPSFGVGSNEFFVPRKKTQILESEYFVPFVSTGATIYNDTISDTITPDDSEAVAVTFVTTFSDAVTSAESTSVAVTFRPTTSDAMTPTDSEAVAVTFRPTTSDAMTPTDSEAVVVTYVTTVADAFTPADSEAVAVTFRPTTSDAMTPTDSEAVAVTFRPTTSDAMTPTDSEAVAVTFRPTTSDAVTPTDSEAVAVTFRPTTSDAITPADSEAVAVTFRPTTSDAITPADSEAVAVTFRPTISDTTTFNDTMIGGMFQNVTISDSITAGDTLTAAVIFRPTISDTVISTDTISAAATFRPTISDTTTLVDMMVGGLLQNVTFSDSIATGDTLAATVTFRPTTSDTLTLNGSNAASVTFRPSISDIISLIDSQVARVIFAGQITDTLTVSDGSSVTVIFNAVTTDSITLADVMLVDLISGRQFYAKLSGVWVATELYVKVAGVWVRPEIKLKVGGLWV